MKKRTESGFTLYELLITLLIVGVVLTLGVPNLTQFTRNSRITSTANDLHASFMMARSEAAHAKANVTICASANALSANPSCGGTWEQGYIVFRDDNVDGVIDLSDGNAAVDADEPILRAHGEIAEGVSLAVADNAAYFMYASTGLGRAIAGSTPISQVVICDDRGIIEASQDTSAARLFVATPLGRATIIRDSGTIDAGLLTDMGVTCP